MTIAEIENKINEKFLDIQIASGRYIYLTHDPEEYLNTPTFFSKELQYLKRHNFIFKKEGELWHVIR